MSIVNLYQALRAQTGLELADPYSVLSEIFQQYPSAADSGTMPRELIYIFRDLVAKNLPQVTVKSKALQIEAGVKTTYDSEVQKSDSLTIDMIKPGSNEFKIIGYLIMVPNRTPWVHYVLVQNAGRERMTVINPEKPEADEQYWLKPVALNGLFIDGKVSTVELLVKKGLNGLVPDGTRMVLVSVTTLSRDLH